MLNGIDGFLNGGWNPSTTNITFLRRVRVLSIICFFMVVVCVPFMIRAIQWQIPLRIFNIAICMLCPLVILFLLRRQCFHAAVHVAVFTIFWGGFNQFVTCGGLYSGVAGWWIMVILMAGLMLNLKAGLVWTGIVLFTISLLVALEMKGAVFLNLTPPEYQYSHMLLQIAGQMAATLFFMIAYLIEIRFTDHLLEKKQTELQQQIIRAEAAEEHVLKVAEAKVHFLRTMSHELQTPLHIIIGFSRRVKKSAAGTLTEREHQALDQVIVQGERMSQQVSQLLAMSDSTVLCDSGVCFENQKGHKSRLRHDVAAHGSIRESV